MPWGLAPKPATIFKEWGGGRELTSWIRDTGGAILCQRRPVPLPAETLSLCNCQGNIKPSPGNTTDLPSFLILEEPRLSPLAHLRGLPVLPQGDLRNQGPHSGLYQLDNFASETPEGQLSSRVQNSCRTCVWPPKKQEALWEVAFQDKGKEQDRLQGILQKAQHRNGGFSGS